MKQLSIQTTFTFISVTAFRRGREQGSADSGRVSVPVEGSEILELHWGN